MDDENMGLLKRTAYGRLEKLLVPQNYQMRVLELFRRLAQAKFFMTEL